MSCAVSLFPSSSKFSYVCTSVNGDCSLSFSSFLLEASSKGFSGFTILSLPLGHVVEVIYGFNKVYSERLACSGEITSLYWHIDTWRMGSLEILLPGLLCG